MIMRIPTPQADFIKLRWPGFFPFCGHFWTLIQVESAYLRLSDIFMKWQVSVIYMFTRAPALVIDIKPPWSLFPYYRGKGRG